MGCELLDENDLKVTVVIEEILEVLGRALSTEFHVLVSDGSRLVRLLGGEVEMHGRKTWLVDPSIPVDSSENSVSLGLVEVVLDKVFPVESELVGDDRSLLVIENVLPEESLEHILTNEALKIVKKLEALVIRNGRESIIR